MPCAILAMRSWFRASAGGPRSLKGVAGAQVMAKAGGKSKAKSATGKDLVKTGKNRKTMP